MDSKKWYERLRVSFLCLFLLFPVLASAQEQIVSGETLDVERCIGIGLKNHPNVAGAEGTVRASRSRVYEAKSGYWPQVSATGAYSRNRGGGTSGLTGRESFNQYQGAVGLNQTILDFGRTSSEVEVEKWGAQASEEDLQDTSRQIVYGVQEAYYGILQAQERRDADEEAVKQFELHLEQAKKFYEVGTRARIDVTNAEVNLGQAKQALINAENAVKIAKVTLNNAMGVPDAPEYKIEETAGFKDYPIELETALKRGYENRPDLASARARYEGAKRSVEVARTGYYPVLSGNAQYGYGGEEFPLENEWTFGATLSIPIFSGFLTKYQVEESRGNVEVARANEAFIRQGVTLEIQQAYYNLQDVRERIGVAELTMRQAKENRELAQGRYAAGVGSTIEVTDAVVTEVNARTAYITALYDYHTAVAALQRAMGERR